MQFIPIITDDTRRAWEEYSVTNAGWMTEAREYQAEKGLGHELATTIFNPVIVRFDEEAEFDNLAEVGKTEDG